MLHNLIQSLRDQDLRLAQWIDSINLSISTGGGGGGGGSPIIIDIPKEFDVKIFEKNLFLRIAVVNSDPTSFKNKTKQYGKTERKSHYKRIFKTLGDFSVEAYKNNLVDLTIGKFTDKAQPLPMRVLKETHNNVSHTVRLGLLIKEDNYYKLTPLGEQYWSKKISFEELFRMQMLKYYSLIDDDDGQRILFPYRACLRILLAVKSISYIEFAFGLYSLVDSTEKSLSETVGEIIHLRKKYPNLEILNEANKPKVLAELNEFFEIELSARDIWEKKTTVCNQYIYFRNHLALFSEYILIEDNSKSIVLIEGKEKELDALLAKTLGLENEKDQGKLFSRYIAGFISFIMFNL